MSAKSHGDEELELPPITSSTSDTVKAAGKARVRRTHTKSHFGCATCRKRRIKCDQVSPSCGRCQLAGLVCPGSGPRQSLSRLPFIDLSRDELRSLQYYREKTCNVLAGHFHAGFWTSAILRLSYADETLQRFIIAIGSLDESFAIRSLGYKVLPHDPVPTFEFALNQYGSALNAVVKQATEGTVSVPLLAASMLCLMFELWLGNVTNAREHAFAAQRFLSQKDAEGFTASDENREICAKYLRPMISQDCSKILSLSSAKAMSLTNRIVPTITSCLQSKLILEVSFRDYSDAQAHFDELTTLILSRVRAYMEFRDMKDLRVPWTTLESYLVHWYKRLLELDARLTPDARSCSTARCHLEIRFRVFCINIMCLPFDDEMLYDKHLDDFVAIVNAVEELFELNGIAASSREVKRTKGMQTSNALCLVAFRCRYPPVRRRAIRILYRYLVVEEIDFSLFAGAIAEQVMMLEEKGLGRITKAEEVTSSQRVQVTMICEGRSLIGDDESNTVDETNLAKTVTIFYTRGSSYSRDVQQIQMPFKAYSYLSVDDTQSTVWLPDMPDAKLLNSEVSGLDKCYGWPETGYMGISVYINTNLETACRLDFYTLDGVPE